ncbi:MAG: hypothetical protein QM499_07105 [Flavobacteriaceae bacterium]
MNDISLFYEDLIFSIGNQSKKLIIIGDCINLPCTKNLDFLDIEHITNNLKGNFYAFLVLNDELFVTSSAFGLLSIYYNEDYSILSSSVDLIKEFSDSKLTKNKKWVVNQLLFNYQFGEDTFYNEVSLLPAFSYLKIINGKTSKIKYFEVASAFVEKPIKWKKSIDTLSDLFIKTSQLYIPQDNSVVSFTGGFDGRTLVSVATHFNKNFETFSYGKIENDDVFIPLKNSKKLNLAYNWLNLDDDYSNNEYVKSSFEYIKTTSGTNGLLYAHVDYSAKWLKNKYDYLISGVCGSELFRAAHSSGAVTSKALINLFRLDSFKEYRDSIINSGVFDYIDKDIYNNEIKEQIQVSWDYKLGLPQNLTKNQKLYVFVYEEIFRKFFGDWITAQMKYIKVRTPYIDFDFFKAIIKTELSGAYSDFLTENPLKRFKGQVLYADIIKKTNLNIYNMKTGKGYAPKIIREPILRPLLLIPFLSKRFRRKVKQTNLDNLGIISGVKNYNNELINKKDHKQFKVKKLIADLKDLTPYTNEVERDNLLMSISLLTYSKEQDE